MIYVHTLFYPYIYSMSLGQVEEEMRVLREMGCSYEPKQGINLTSSPGNKWVRSNFTSKQEDKWVRAPGMPAWNDCFSCVFYDNCRGPKDSSFCVPSLRRYGIYMFDHDSRNDAFISILIFYPSIMSPVVL